MTLTGGFRTEDEGRVLVSADGTRYRILKVTGQTATLSEMPALPLPRRTQLWRFLTTAPNGDATRWMA